MDSAAATGNSTAPVAGRISPHTRQVLRQICFAVYVVVVVCSIALTIIFFILAIFDIIFLYIGAGCLALSAVLVLLYVAAARWRRRRQRRRQQTNTSGARRTSLVLAPHQRAAEYRRLEEEIQRLTEELSDLQQTSLCNTSDLDAVRDLVRREYARLAEWIEGVKTPDDSEVLQLSSALRQTSDRLQAIRMRSERISTSLTVRRLPAHIDVRFSRSPPPPYDVPLRDRRSTASADIRRLQPSSLASDAGSSVMRPPPSELGAPPAYEDAVGTPV